MSRRHMKPFPAEAKLTGEAIAIMRWRMRRILSNDIALVLRVLGSAEQGRECTTATAIDLTSLRSTKQIMQRFENTLNRASPAPKLGKALPPAVLF
jgi:hypothetical protein